jgi:branched-chain amino acid transport system substrate-binding protein
LKRFLFLAVGILLILGLVLPGCTGEGPTRGQIIIGVAGPMGNVQGVHMLNGAELAADQINVDGVTLPDDTVSDIVIVNRDTDEILHPDSAAAATQYLITNKHAQFIIGGFRTEAVSDVINSVILDNTVPYFITGAATYSLMAGLTGTYSPFGTPEYPYVTEYAGYKYIFRATPFNDIFLVNNCFLMFEMVASQIQDDLGYTGPAWATGKVRVAVVAENLAWTTPMLESVQAIVGGYGALFGWEFANNITGHENGEWLVNDKDEPNMETYLNQIKSAGAHVIFTILSGPVGVQYGTLVGSLDIPAVSVGINVESQDPGYWAKCGDDNAAHQITMGTWAPNIFQTSATEDFFTAYDDAYGSFPLYTAASYDMVKTLAKAFAAVGTDPDDVVAWLEDLDNAQLGAAGTSGFYPVYDGTTTGAWKGFPVWPALNDTQITDIYGSDTSHYAASCNFTMPPYATHDLIYGPWWTSGDPTSGWQTGIAVQWEDGDIVGIWPAEAYGPTAVGTKNNAYALNIINTLSQAVSGLTWTDMEYDGTEPLTIPAEWITAWGG